VIKAHPTVLIVGAMNPQNYLGVKPLSQEVKSRARIQKVEYPAQFRPDGTVAVDEAVVLSRYLPEFKGMNLAEFTTLWDYTLNNQQANGGDRLTSAERVQAIQKIHQIIKTANRIREAYKAFRIGRSQEIIEFVFSLRETVAITTELNHTQTAKEAIKNVVLPKIADPAELARVKTIIDNV
ncbi:MAG: ATPase, partial [Patescibacteria group bacterium]